MGNRRNFVTSAIVAADPSTASTSSSGSNAVPVTADGRFQRVHPSYKGKGKGKGEESESLTDLLRTQGASASGNDIGHPATSEVAESEGKVNQDVGAVPVKAQTKGRKKPGKKQGRKKLAKVVAAAAGASPTSKTDMISAFAQKFAQNSKATAKRVPALDSATIASIGTDSLQPTSESGFTVSQDSQGKQHPFAGETAEDAVIAKMKELMQPLFQRCYEEKGTESDSDFKRLRATLKHFVGQYSHVRKQAKQLGVQERFLRRIETSKWYSESGSSTGRIEPSEAEQGDAQEELLRKSSADVAFSSRAQTQHSKQAPTSKLAKAKGASAAHQSHLQTLQNKNISADEIVITPITPLHDAPVASLAHGLERVLFNPGTHWLQDPRTDYYNFPPSVQKIPSVDEFDFARLPTFMRPSQDPDLRELLKQSGKKFAGSTSSLTSVLSQIYFALNGQKPLNTQTQSFVDAPRDFSAGVRLPASIVLRRTEEGQYLIDADKAADLAGDNVLSEKGHILEKMLTYPPEEFERFLKTSNNPLQPEESRDKKEAYHYSSTSSLLMRSQLDCHDKRLPRQTFDIKTRGSIALRRDMLNHYQNSGYTITKTTGDLESFEREKYDLIRSAFLKYSMQVRIGAMDGIFLAYHSGERIFGFEYLSLEELDKSISGSHEESQQAFKLCLGTMESLLERAVQDIPGESLRVSFEAFNGGLQVYAQPLAQSVVAAEASEDSTETSDKLRTLIPADYSTPLLLYDVQFTNYLNGYQLGKSENVDFMTWRDPGSMRHIEQDDIAVNKEDTSDIKGEGDETAGEPVSQQSSTSSFGEAFSRILNGSEKTEPVPASESPITWSISLDIALSTDTTFNQGRLSKLRKRQAKFTTQVILPEGLSKSEIALAVKGLSPEEEEGAIKQGEKGGWSMGRFRPRSGVQYVQRTYGIVGELRKLAKVGREKLQDKERDSS